MMWRKLGALLGIMSALVVLLTAGACPAHETDQFSVPDGEFADLGPYLNEWFIGNIEEGVRKINKKIARVVKDRRGRKTNGPGAALARYHSPDFVADEVRSAFGPAIGIIEGLDRKTKSKKMNRQYPGKVLSYQAKNKGQSIYNGLYFPLDPRNITTFFHASTVMVYGYYLGTDKMGHFADMGHHYYRAYRRGIKRGLNERQAAASGVKLGTNGMFSEEAILGYATAGSYSNADLVSNYVGFLFYRNLTEPTMIKGRLRDPILVLDENGEYWRVAPCVRGEPKFFERFVSHHYDEALNPNLYQPIIRKTLRKKIEKRCPSLMKWYRRHHGDHDPAEFFTTLTQILSTYYGDDYGHSGELENTYHLGNICCG